MSIKRTDRMREVLALLRDRGEVASQSLCTELGVSPATLRRDLSELEDQGLLLRTHGGARALDPSGSEIPVRLRDHRMVAIKRRIAQHAAALIPPGPQAVALTGGVTTAEVARSLKGRSQMTIVTNSLTIAADCAVDAHMKVIATGGLVRANTLEAVGPMSEHAFQVVTVGTAVLGADSYAWFNEHGGMTAANGKLFRDGVLSRGGTVDAHQLYLNFRGGEPSVAPLLKQRGLVSADSMAPAKDKKAN